MTEQKTEIRNVWAVIASSSSSIIELRALWPNGTGTKQAPITKHFRGKDYETKEQLKEAFEDEALRLNEIGYNIYTTLNPIHPDFKGSAVTDSDIHYRDLILIDIDKNGMPTEPSTEDELGAARQLADEVQEFLACKEWPSPIRIMSGNGHHLYYPLKDVPNDQKSTIFVQQFLKGLAAKFNNKKVKIDTVVYNASRITKVVGTIARKGVATPERPHRMARLYEK